MLGTGIEITEVGSRNPGNDVLRVSSKWRAAIALVGDIREGLPGGGRKLGTHWLVVIAP
jgi:hypothetical protein